MNSDVALKIALTARSIKNVPTVCRVVGPIPALKNPDKPCCFFAHAVKTGIIGREEIVYATGGEVSRWAGISRNEALCLIFGYEVLGHAVKTGEEYFHLAKHLLTKYNYEFLLTER